MSTPNPPPLTSYMGHLLYGEARNSNNHTIEGEVIMIFLRPVASMMRGRTKCSRLRGSKGASCFILTLSLNSRLFSWKRDGQKIAVLFSEASVWSASYTVYPGSCDPFYILSYYIKFVTTSWTHSTPKAWYLNLAYVLWGTWFFETIVLEV